MAVFVLILGSLAAVEGAAPYAATQPATRISPTAAFLSSMTVPNGLPSMAWFEWGANGTFSSNTPPYSVGSGTAVVGVSSWISGLNTKSDWCYRLVVSNAHGVTYGGTHWLYTGRAVTAWGNNDAGQTNLPSSLNQAVGLSAGGFHNLALKSDGRVVAWGAGKVDFESYPHFRQSRVPAAVTNVVAVAAGGFHSLALDANGIIYAWGGNWVGQAAAPVFPTFVIGIAAGNTHSLALGFDGTVWAWGDNYYGQTNVPAGLTNIVAVAAGFDHSLALRADGTVVKWGSSSLVPAGLTNVVAIDTGWRDMALRADGTCVVWGSAGVIETNLPAGLISLRDIAAGGEHLLALKAGQVIAWGNGVAQMNVPPLSNVVAIAAGDSHSVAAIRNLLPMANAQSASGMASQDLLMTLTGADPTGDALSFRITTLPAKGQLYQCVNGLRGALIAATNTFLSDTNGRVIFVPVPNEYATPYTAFGFTAYDGEADSIPVMVTINITVNPGYVFTQQATLIRSNSAVLNGMVLANGLSSVAWFEWGTNGGFGQFTSSVGVGSGTTVIQTTSQLTGLGAGGVYQFRCVVSNALGVAYGAPQWFTTGRRIISWGYNFFGMTNYPAGLSNTVAVAAGGFHGVALKADGTVRAWGDNTFGQRSVPSGLGNVVALAAGNYHTLALLTNGTVDAWGAGLSDTGISPHRGQSAVPDDLTNVVAVAAGSHHSLALKKDGTIVGWGNTNSGQTTIPNGLSNVVAIAAGSSHSLALRADGTVFAWGSNSDGQTNVPVGLNSVVAVAANVDFSLALRADGSLVAWGDNVSGQTNVPVLGNSITKIVAGGNGVMVVYANGSTTIWGNSNYDQTNAPVAATNVVAAAKGGSFTILIGPNIPPQATAQTTDVTANYDSIIRLAGTDVNLDTLGFQLTTPPTSGQLYQYVAGVRGSLLVPGATVSDPLGRVIFSPAINATGGDYANFSFTATDGELFSTPATVAIGIAPCTAFTQLPTLISTTNATLNGVAVPNGYPSLAWFEWGPEGEIGNVSSTFNLNGGSSVRFNHMLTGLTSNRVYQYRLVVSNATHLGRGVIQRFATGRRPAVWGSNTNNESSGPTSFTTAVALACGSTHSLMLKTDGKVQGFGNNTYGQTTVPSTLTNVVAIAAGYDHSLALRSDGKVVAWGRNVFGQTNVPTTLSNVTAIAAGFGYNVALRADGTVVAWGNNSYGQTNVPVMLAPVVAISARYQHSLALTTMGTVVAWGTNGIEIQVPSDLTDVVGIAAGVAHNVAVRADGSVIAWGANDKGQTNIPAGLSNIVAVAAGQSHSLALRADGILAAWGNNSAGQTNVPSNLVNVAALSAGNYNTFTIANRRPNASVFNITAPANRDRTLTLSGFDAENEPLVSRITALPAAGALFQYTINGRGAPILAAETLVTDSSKRVIFAPLPDTFGTPYATLKYVVHDGITDSADGIVNLSIQPPPPPVITSLGVISNGVFQVSFTGDSNTAHCVWISTNLSTWQYFGPATQVTPGGFAFLDLYATNCPQRFYRVQAACHAPALAVSGYRRRSDGSFELIFSALPGNSHPVQASTNLLDWQTLGVASENAPGLYRFIDSGAAAHSRRFYRLSVP